MKLSPVAALMVGLAAAISLLFAFSRGPDPDKVPTSNEVTKRIMSPYCEGLLVADCPSSESGQLRSRIEERVEAGWTNERIDAWLVANYGESILARPRGYVSWLIPLSAMTAFFALLALAVWKWRRVTPASTEAVITEEERDRVKADFDRYTREITE